MINPKQLPQPTRPHKSQSLLTSSDYQMLLSFAILSLATLICLLIISKTCCFFLSQDLQTWYISMPNMLFLTHLSSSPLISFFLTLAQVTPHTYSVVFSFYLTFPHTRLDIFVTYSLSTFTSPFVLWLKICFISVIMFVSVLLTLQNASSKRANQVCLDSLMFPQLCGRVVGHPKS